MSIASNKAICLVCNKARITYICQGCSGDFCLDDLSEHRKNLNQQLDQIENDHDELRQNFNDQKLTLIPHPLTKEIDRWEQKSIDKIRQRANEWKERLVKYTNHYFLRTEKEFNHLSKQIKETRGENDFDEVNLNYLKQLLKKLERTLDQPSNISIKEHSTSLINNISIRIPILMKDTLWKQIGITVAGGRDQGDRLDQICGPNSFCIDDIDQTIYIAGYNNSSIVEWRMNSTNGRTLNNGDGPQNQNKQLKGPADVIIDRESNSLIIADEEKRQVIRWSWQTPLQRQTIMSDIDCWGLAMHRDGSLYVSDWKKHEVRRWKKGETTGTIVAGGNKQGNQLNQLNFPTHLFLDDDHVLYVSDSSNNRVMKWVEGAEEGIIVAGGNGPGSLMTQLSDPRGVFVDQFNQIYVADCGNARVMRWCAGAKEGTIMVGGNGNGDQANQLHRPSALSFDEEGNLYVADYANHRIQKFVIDEH